MKKLYLLPTLPVIDLSAKDIIMSSADDAYGLDLFDDLQQRVSENS